MIVLFETTFLGMAAWSRNIEMITSQGILMLLHGVFDTHMTYCRIVHADIFLPSLHVRTPSRNPSRHILYPFTSHMLSPALRRSCRLSHSPIPDYSYMTLPLPYLTQTLAFETNSEADHFLTSHEAAIYIQPPPPTPTVALLPNAWKPIQKPVVIPLAERVWDCKKAVGAIVRGGERYRVVDLKGQVD
jgi:hypothetical protein